MSNELKQANDTIRIQLQADADGRYGFNVKVIEWFHLESILKHFFLFIQGGGDEQTPIVVSRVALDTPADFAQLHEGDQILSINQINIEYLSHEDVR